MRAALNRNWRMKLRLLFAILILPHTGSATAPEPATHCSSTEQVVFSCATARQQIISLCASCALTTTSGYLQYRFGKRDRAPELIYPASQAHPAKHFLSRTLTYAGGGGAYLKFSNGGFSYIVFTGIGKGWEKEGVVVNRSGKQIAYLSCAGPWTSAVGPDLFQKAGIPGDPDEFEIP